MELNLDVATFNTESGCRPGFHDYLQTYIETTKPDVVTLQEVHSARSADVPETFMPGNPGKRIYPQRLRLLEELRQRHEREYEFFFAPHLFGLHDCEQGEHDVAFGQVTMVRRQTWTVTHAESSFVFQDKYCFNTEHELGNAGQPCSKIAISVVITSHGHSVLVTNVHGFWVSRGKIDLPERFIQNQGIARQMSRVLSVVHTPYVLCAGDLNYRSDMQALEHLRSQPVFGSNGRVLNHEFEVNRTRTDFYTNWQNEPEADFMVASEELAQQAVSLKADMSARSDHALVQGRFKIK